MKLSGNEIRAAYFAVSTCQRALAGRRIPSSITALAARLETIMLTGEVSPTRQQCDCATKQLEETTPVEWIGSKLAAEMLGWDIRRVQRAARRGDLDCQMIGHRWAFPAHAVADYAAAKENDK